MIIIKRVSAGANENGIVYHKDVSANNSLILNDTFSAGVGSWNNTAPTLSEFTIAAVAGVNTSGVNYIAYCFAEIPGFSKFTKYPSNDSATRPFTYCNFSPKFFLLKTYTSAFRNRWVAFDAARGGSFSIAPNDAGVDSTAVSFQITSNGFKLLSAGGSPVNVGDVLVAAFAEAPFKYALAKF